MLNVLKSFATGLAVLLGIFIVLAVIGAIITTWPVLVLVGFAVAGLVWVYHIGDALRGGSSATEVRTEEPFDVRKYSDRR